MSDILLGWPALLSLPLGADPQEETPLAVLPCVHDLAHHIDPRALSWLEARER